MKWSIYPEEPIGYPAHTGHISLSVRPSGIPKHVDFECRNKNQGVQVEFSVRHPSPPNTYSYVWEENLGSTRKFVEIFLLFTCITNHTCCAWAGGTFFRCHRKVPPAHAQQVYWYIPESLLSSVRCSFSLVPDYLHANWIDINHNLKINNLHTWRFFSSVRTDWS